MRSSLNGTLFHGTSSNKSSEACKKDVELPLLPTGPGQDTDIVDLCVNSSCFASCKSGSCELRLFVRSCSTLLLILFVRTIYSFVCNENIKLKKNICCHAFLAQYIYIRKSSHFVFKRSFNSLYIYFSKVIHQV